MKKAKHNTGNMGGGGRAQYAKMMENIRQDFHTAPYINYACILYYSCLEQGNDSDACMINVWGCVEIFLGLASYIFSYYPKNTEGGEIGLVLLPG